MASQPYADRLNWFSGNWTGYRTQTLDSPQFKAKTTQLVVDDLRMMAGDTAYFSFVLALKAKQNAEWRAIIPTDAPVVTVDNKPEVSRMELVKQGFIRVFDESVVDEDGGWELVD